MPGAYGHADPLLLLLAALLLEAYLGAFGWLDRLLRAPKRWLARGAAALTRKLDRPERGAAARARRGALAALLLVGAALLLGGLLALFTRYYPFAWALELLLLAALLQQRRIVLDVERLLAAAASGSTADLEEAFRRLERGRAEPGADIRRPAPELLARAPEEIARRLVADLAAPLFWFLLLGLAGSLAQQAARLLAVTLRHGASPPFARPAARLDRLLAWLPDRLAALLLALLSGRGQTLGAALASPSPTVAALALTLGRQAKPQDRTAGTLAVLRRFCLLQGGLLLLALVLRFALA